MEILMVLGGFGQQKTKPILPQRTPGSQSFLNKKKDILLLLSGLCELGG